MEDKSWWAMGLVITLFGYAFVYYLGRLHKLIGPAKGDDVDAEPPPLETGTVIDELLRFSATTWVIFQKDGILRAAPNLHFVLRGFAKTNTLEDLFQIIRHDFHEPLRFFLKTLQEEGRPFYFQAKTTRDKLLDIKARPYGTSTVDETTSPHQEKCYLFYIKHMVGEEGAETAKRTQSNFDLVKQIVNDIALPCWFKRQDGQMLHANYAFEKMSNQSLREILDQNLDIVERRSQAANDMSYARAHKQCYRSKNTVILGGIKRLLDVQESPLRLEFPFQEELFLGVAVDHTLEATLKKRLQKHHHAFHSLLENLSIGIAIYGADTRLIFYNQIYAKFADYGEGDAWLQKKPTIIEVLDTLSKHQRMPPQPNYADFKKNRLAMFQTLTSAQEEILYFPDGSIVRVTISPYPGGGIFYTLEDITDKLHLADRYNTLIDFLNATLDNLYEGIAVVGEDGKLTLYNPAFLHLWGFDDKKSFKGTPFLNLMESAQAAFSDQPCWQRHHTTLINAFSSRKSHRGPLKGLLANEGVVFSYTPLPNGTHLCSYVKLRAPLGPQEPKQDNPQKRRLKA